MNQAAEAFQTQPPVPQQVAPTDIADMLKASFQKQRGAYLADPIPDAEQRKQDLLALPLREAREQFERAYLQQQLVLCDGKVGQLAKRVGMERTHLYRKLRSLGVDFKSVGADD